MSRFHHETVVSAVKHIAFAHVQDFDSRPQLPFQEPAFRFLKPDERIEESIEAPVLISKKPEGQREIFVGLYDQVDNYIYMYTMTRERSIHYVIPSSVGPHEPVVLPQDLEDIRTRDRKNRRVLFVYDICRVLDEVNRQVINVVIRDLSPQGYRLESMSPDTLAWMKSTYNVRTKTFREYKSLDDIHETMTSDEDFPYRPENGVLFLQGSVPMPNSPCVKYTPPDHARVYIAVQPVTTVSARIWRLHVLDNGTPKFFRAIPAVPGFFVPPIGAVVAFKIDTNEEGYWRFVPTHIRVDKQFPSAIQTVQRFISRHRSGPSDGARRRRRPATDAPPTTETNAFEDKVLF